MANDASSFLKNQVLPSALAVLRENSIMATKVWNDFEDKVVSQTDTINIVIPEDMGDPLAMNFATGNAAKNLAPKNVPMKVDDWVEQPFQISDKEIEATMMTGYLPSAIQSAVKGMANYVDKKLLALGKSVYQFSGTAGTTPATIDAYTLLRKRMNDAVIPDDFDDQGRFLVIDTSAEQKFNSLFSTWQQVGQRETMERGKLVDKFNMQIYMDQNVQTMTNGTSTGATVGTCAAAAKITNLTGAGAAATILPGMLFTVAGVGTTQQFTVTNTVTADGAGAVTGMTFEPAAPVALTGGTLTFIASHVMNLGFSRKAFAIAWRPITGTTTGLFAQNLNSVRETLVDPISGVPMTMEMWRDPKTSQTMMAIRMAFGVVCSDARLAVRFLG